MAGQRRQREGSTSTADARAFLRWAQTHTTSVSIVSMQDSNAATSATGGPGASGPRGEQQGTDRMTKMRVSCSAGVTTTSPPLALLQPSSAPLSGPVMVVTRKRLRLVDSRQHTFFFFPDTECPLACRYRDTAKVLISGLAPRALARPILQVAHTFLPMAFPRSCTCASPDLSRFQCCIHPDRVSRLVLVLVLVPLFYFAEPSLSPS